MREGKRERIQLKHQEEPVTEDHTRTHEREELARKKKTLEDDLLVDQNAENEECLSWRISESR
jgi:hypothetical protein